MRCTGRMIADVKLKSFPGVVFVANKIDCRETVSSRLTSGCDVVIAGKALLQTKSWWFSLTVHQTDDLDKILLAKRKQLMDDGWFAPSFCCPYATPASATAMEPVHSIFGVCALEALLAQQVLSGATYTKALELHAVAGKHLRTTGLSPEDRRACAAETTEDALELLTHVDPMTRAAALTRTTRNVFLGSRFGVFQMALHSRLQMAADSVRELCLRYCNEVMRGLEPYMTCGNDIVC
jgi:hypothetical protein